MNRSAMLTLPAPGAETSVLTTGCLSLDWALGCGGFPRGHLVEIFGPPDSGKTTLGLEAIAAAQRAGGVGAFLDAEHSLNAVYASGLGVDTNSLIYAQPSTAYHALEVTRSLVKTCAVDVVVLDSVAALGPDPNPPTSAPTPSRGAGFDYWPFVNGLRALHALLPKSPCCVIFLNQLRSRLRVEIGSAETTVGAPALHCFASVRIRLERRATITARGEAIGIRSALKVTKNVLGHRGREAEFQIQCSGGISREVDLVSLALRAGVITRGTHGLSYRRTGLGMTLPEACAMLRENRPLFDLLDLELRERAGLGRNRPLAAATAGA
ncbi:MAG: DNA recombination/repair protein RecA [Bryobacterales bacterium]|nr:DNA recombination/repair protein RecA [Bryobacterales bacterium]